MDIIKLYNDYNIQYVTGAGNGKHARDGWVNVPCPYCVGTFGHHLGWNEAGEYFSCYRCGWHSPIKTFGLLLGLNFNETKVLVRKYRLGRKVTENSPKKAKKQLLLPTHLTRLQQNHLTYLEERNFDTKKLIRQWHIKGTGPLSMVGELRYKHRIFIPYYWNGEIVTFDTRDISGKAEEKYKACPPEREIMERKKILYGDQESWQEFGICLEGPTDVWRFGPLCFATSGIAFTKEQVNLIAQIFKFIFIVFDSEPQAQKQAKKLRSELMGLGTDSEIIIIKKGDPGSMPQAEADEFVANLVKRYHEKIIHKIPNKKRKG